VGEVEHPARLGEKPWKRDPERRGKMRKAVTGIVAVAAVAAFGWASAWAQVQSTHEAGMPKVTTSQITGEVVYVNGNYLVAKMQPSGHYRGFNVQPNRVFSVDGQQLKIGDLKMGTVLTATAVTTEQPMVVRTHDVLGGTVFWASGDYVILTNDKGENREYTVPDSYQFKVEGKPATVNELKKGMKVQATKIVEEPFTEFSTKVVVTGNVPK
jgi:hypothetical protein